jgi:5,5'-dehydrodivanillate O-demethylase oxygenase subunit
MLTTEMNERLTRVGPGTQGGNLMRRYWMPIAAHSQLLDEPVRKVRVLGEDLVLYRTTKGVLGLVGDRCLHRRVDLQYGFPDDRGLRCPYHGWLYGETGECLERPMEKSEHPLKQCIKAYPVRELGGLIFAYLGPLPAPVLPRWDLFVWPNAIRQIAFNVIDCNWLQCQENTGDPVHSAWLHGAMFRFILERQGQADRIADPNHTIHGRIQTGVGIQELYAKPTRHGIEKGVIYAKKLGAAADRVSRHSTVIFPFFTQTGSPGSPRSEYQIRVPMDDTHTLHICYQTYCAPPGVKAPEQDVVPWYEPPLFDEKGRPVLDYVLAQDVMAWRAQGAIVDRSVEILGRTDIPIVLLRQQLDEQIRLVEQGSDPMNVFREPLDIIYGSGAPPEGWTDPNWAVKKLSIGQQFRQNYHQGFDVDDADRYGPATPLVRELHRRIAEAENAAMKAETEHSRASTLAV